MQNTQLRILVVDDSTFDRQLIRRMLENVGHQVTLAADGVEAINLFPELEPELVIMDAGMPTMDGCAATQWIKMQAGSSRVPVLFISGSGDDITLTSCLASGGDDFLVKPVRPLVLNAKVAALHRNYKEYRDVHGLNCQLLRKLELLELEFEMAERLLAGYHRPLTSLPDNIKLLCSPQGIAGGDLFLAESGPDDLQYLLVGDVSGHGIAAAIGALPVIEVFCSMAGRGERLADIAATINQLLYKKTTVDFFMAAMLVIHSPRRQELEVWNAGMPVAYLHQAGSGVVASFPSRCRPLGIASFGSGKFQSESLAVDSRHRLLVCSDGLIEAENRFRENLGQQRIIDCISNNRDPASLFEEMRECLARHRHGQVQHDDLTLVELHCKPPAAGAMTDMQCHESTFTS